MMTIALFSGAMAALLAVYGYNVIAGDDPDTGRPEQTTLTPGESADSDPSLRSIGDSYLSPVTQADQPFTHMLVRWDAVEPVEDTLQLEVRASVDNATWTDWGMVGEDHDLWVPEDGDQVHWSQIIYAGEDARFWQVRATLLPAPDGQLPEIRSIDVNTVDARFGEQEPVASSDAAEIRVVTTASVNKPAVVSRTGWGSPDGQGSRVGPAYHPVNHIVVHHTADANNLQGSERSWADRVRAIWSFHTYTRGWGDVGYNFLIDPNGVIYEGRSGGDDAVAFHDTANYGSMGVVVIGTYASVTPPQGAQDSLVRLLAWKSAQKSIDPLGSSYYYGCDRSDYCRPYNANAITPNIAGHRQITPGHTTCPGDQFLNLLPTIRNRVKTMLDNGGSQFVPDNGDLTIDELEQHTFAYSAANWYSAGCGNAGHTFYTYATSNPAESTNSATWRPNIPQTGYYRIYAHIPQGCGLGSPPYASTQARYFIHTSSGDFHRDVDHNTSEEWVDLGVYQFNQGTDGAVELKDLTSEPYDQQRLLFFDSIKWVAEDVNVARTELVNIAYDHDTIASGELLKVTFTVRNTGNATVYGQGPQAAMHPAGGYDVENGYVYDEGECFLGASGQDYPAFPKEADRVRVILGATNRTVECNGDAGGFPWRWGINGELRAGETQDIIGYIRFREPGSVTLRTNIVQEYVDYHIASTDQKTITVTPEQQAPLPASYNASLQPLAHVYRLGAIPDSLLARTQNALSITRGEYMGSFAWNGTTLNWGEGGPFGLGDGFVIEQTRVFMAPRSGTYTFRTTSDDGSWLWVDGQPVVINYGLHGFVEKTGQINLDAGPHVLSFKYFERTGMAAVEYMVKLPGDTSFSVPQEGLFGNAFHIGTTFVQPPDLTLAADDLGGSGVTRLRYSWNGSSWNETSGNLLRLGRLVDGNYRLRYQAVDAAGNSSLVQELAFVVDRNAEFYQQYMPLVQNR